MVSYRKIFIIEIHIFSRLEVSGCGIIIYMSKQPICIAHQINEVLNRHPSFIIQKNTIGSIIALQEMCVALVYRLPKRCIRIIYICLLYVYNITLVLLFRYGSSCWTYVQLLTLYRQIFMQFSERIRYLRRLCAMSYEPLLFHPKMSAKKLFRTQKWVRKLFSHWNPEHHNHILKTVVTTAATSVLVLSILVSVFFSKTFCFLGFVYVRVEFAQ